MVIQLFLIKFLHTCSAKLQSCMTQGVVFFFFSWQQCILTTEKKIMRIIADICLRTQTTCYLCHKWHKEQLVSWNILRTLEDNTVGWNVSCAFSLICQQAVMNNFPRQNLTLLRPFLPLPCGTINICSWSKIYLFLIHWKIKNRNST